MSSKVSTHNSFLELRLDLAVGLQLLATGSLDLRFLFFFGLLCGLLGAPLDDEQCLLRFLGLTFSLFSLSFDALLSVSSETLLSVSFEAVLSVSFEALLSVSFEALLSVSFEALLSVSFEAPVFGLLSMAHSN